MKEEEELTNPFPGGMANILGWGSASWSSRHTGSGGRDSYSGL